MTLLNNNDYCAGGDRHSIGQWPAAPQPPPLNADGAGEQAVGTEAARYGDTTARCQENKGKDSS